MSEDTQSRLKAFLERNKNRISGPTNDNEKTTQNPKVQETTRRTDPSHTNKLLNNSFSSSEPQGLENRIPTESSQQQRTTAKDFDGISFEYQPVSLFAVIGNTSYDDRGSQSGFGRNDNMFQTQSSADNSVDNHYPERDIDTNYNSNPFTSQLGLSYDKRNGNKDIVKSNETNFKGKVGVNQGQTKEKIQEEKYLDNKMSNKEPVNIKSQEESQPKSERQVNEPFSKKKNEIGAENLSISYATLEDQKSLKTVSQNQKVPKNSFHSGSKSSEGTKSPEVNVSEMSFESKEEKNTIQLIQSDHEKRIKDINIQKNDSQNKNSSHVPVNKASRVSPQRNKEEKSKENIESADLYAESSKKLTELNDSISHDSGFKKEIRTLMKVIRQEKEQVVKDIKTMADDLNKYKKAYKLLQRQEKAKNELKNAGQTSPKKGEHNIGKTKSETKENSNVKEKKKPEEENLPNKTLEQGSISEFRPSTQERMRLSSNYIPIPEQELNKDTVTRFIINDMNLDPKLFYKEPVELDGENDKPTITDLISSQREIINFLVKRYQTAEHDRLKTEEEISKMMSSMETTITLLEKKDIHSRSSLSPSPVNSAKKKTSVHY